MPYVAGALVGVGASRSTGPARSRAVGAPLDESSPPGSPPGRPPARTVGRAAAPSPIQRNKSRRGLHGGARGAGGEELLVRPLPGAGPLGRPLDGGRPRRRLQHRGQTGEFTAGRSRPRVAVLAGVTAPPLPCGPARTGGRSRPDRAAGPRSTAVVRAAQIPGGRFSGRAGQGLVGGPAPPVGRDRLPAAGDPHSLQAGSDLDQATDGRGVHRVVVGAQPDAVVTRQPQRHPSAWAQVLWLTTSFTADYDQAAVNRFVGGPDLPMVRQLTRCRSPHRHPDRLIARARGSSAAAAVPHELTEHRLALPHTSGSVCRRVAADGPSPSVSPTNRPTDAAVAAHLAYRRLSHWRHRTLP